MMPKQQLAVFFSLFPPFKETDNTVNQLPCKFITIFEVSSSILDHRDQANVFVIGSYSSFKFVYFIQLSSSLRILWDCRETSDIFSTGHEMFFTKYFPEAHTLEVVAVKTMNSTQSFLKYHFSQSNVKYHFTQHLKRPFRKIASYFSKYKVTFRKLS